MKDILTVLGGVCLGCSFLLNSIFPLLSFLGLILIWPAIKTRSTPDIITIYITGFISSAIVLGWMSVAKKGTRFDDWLMLSTAFGTFWLLLPLTAKILKSNAVVTLPIAIGVLELSYKYIWAFVDKTGWTMYELGNASANNFIAQTADIGGSIFVSMILAFLAGCCIEKKYWRLGLVALVVIAIYANYRFYETSYTDGPTVCLIPSPKFKDLDQLKYEGILLTSEGAAINKEDKEKLIKSGESNAVAIGTYFNEFNSIRLFQYGKEKERYDKIKLVPWSEFEPLKGDNKFTHGSNYPVYQYDKFKFANQICYDLAYSNVTREYMKQKPDFFLVASTESHGPEGWVANDMLLNTQMRAIESRRAFVRNVSGGYSGIVNSNGKYINDFPVYLKDFTTIGPIPIDNRTTLYSIWGDWFVVSIIIFNIIFINVKNQHYPLQ